MNIRYVQGESRAVDNDTGEYIKTKYWHYQHPTREYSIYSADGAKMFTATVEQEDIDLSGNGQFGLYKINVLRI